MLAPAGVVGDAIRDLELIRKAGIEGLAPVFDLLESARGQNAQYAEHSNGNID